MAKLFQHYLSQRGGNIAIVSCLALPILIVLAGGAVDLLHYSNQRSKLQIAADASALAGARKFTLAGANELEIQSFVLSEIDFLLAEKSGSQEFSRSATVSSQENTVVTTISQTTNFMFLKSMMPLTMTVTSEAVAKGQVKLCALALNENADETITINDSASLVANECSLFSNSTSSSGINADMDASITADLICSSGGYIGSTMNYSVTPLTDCPAFKDPLKNVLTPPSYGGCDEVDYEVGNVTIETEKWGILQLKTIGLTKFTLSPGVYCGGIDVFELADLTFEPGVYIIKDGPLQMKWKSKIKGEGVVFYFTGDDAILDVGTSASLDFSAPKTGQLAGVLFMDDPLLVSAREHVIRSADARNLLGTFYFPNASLLIDTNQPVGDQSAYTIIVANQIKLQGQPAMYLNSNYSATDVPVPPGVGPIGGTTFLRK